MLFLSLERAIHLKHFQSLISPLSQRVVFSDLALRRHLNWLVTSRERGVLGLWRHIRRLFLRVQIVLYHNGLSHSGEQPKQHISTHDLWQPTVACIAVFHKYCCSTKRGGTIKNWLHEIIGVYYWWVKIPHCGYMEHGLSYITFYGQKLFR